MRLGYAIIYVKDVAKTVAFYQAALGLTCRFATECGDYAEMDTGAATLSFAREDLAGSHGFDFAPIRPDAPPVGIEVCLISDDVPAAYAHAIANGAVGLAAPKAKPWGQVVAFLRDCNGALVEIASPMGG